MVWNKNRTFRANSAASGTQSMNAVQSLALASEWKERLGLTGRARPEFYETSADVADVPHASAIRAALDELGVSAVFCVQDVPTVIVLALSEYDRARIIETYGALWNQGLASLLLVIAGDTLRAFSLAKKPYANADDDFDKRCLVQILDTTADVLDFRNLIYGAESGRLWKEHADFFDPKERIDQVLLENLNRSYAALCELGLSSISAQALLIQIMFIAYLEDREIIGGEYFRSSAHSDTDSLSSLLEKRNSSLLRSVFSRLREDFNGDLFVAPSSFESKSKAEAVNGAHIEILWRFHAGREDMKSGQLRFWGYDFKFIPIELVSAVYDRFLGERENDRRQHGAYYTPMFLADTVVSQAWELLPPDLKEKGRFLDPACGSGIFLVRSFQRLCEQWRLTHKSRAIPWRSLLALLRRIHGWDVNGSAVRVAVFSLYVALLEEVSPPDLKALLRNGKLLPELWETNLIAQNFFEVDSEKKFEVIIGNPPWTSRKGTDRASVKWSSKNSMPMPGGEDAWAFVWKAQKHLSPQGLVAFLLPAMGFLHNHSANTVSARNRFFARSRILRIVNFADLRFQLFDGAIRPAALFVFCERTSAVPYQLDYWAPKADLNMQIRRQVTLSSADKFLLNSEGVVSDPFAFKQRLWMREPDAKLFAYLSNFSRLNNLVKEYGDISRRKLSADDQWVIGQGFQPRNRELEKEPSYSISRYVGRFPNLPIEAFHRLAQPVSGLTPWKSSHVRRKGFEQGFQGARVLVSRGIETKQMRLQATYVSSPLTFQDIIQAIAVPRGEERRAKLLTALLSSRVAIWFAFHGTASFGSERPEVKQSELLRMPFPSLAELPEPQKAEKAAAGLVAIVDDAISKSDRFLMADDGEEALRQLDAKAYEFFCLSDSEVILIEDAIERIIPSIQPSQGSYPDIWKSPTESERRDFATTLVANMRDWFDAGTSIRANLEAISNDLGIIRLSLGRESGATIYSELSHRSLDDVLDRLSQSLRQPLGYNFQLIPDFRAFVGDSLYLIKPMQRRFWLKSAAIADADSIAMDLQTSVDAASGSRSH